MTSSETVPIIAVDGPGGAGKGMVCAMLHRWLGWHVLDSGLLYRAAALAVRQAGLTTASGLQEEVRAAVAAMDCSVDTAADGSLRLYLGGRECTAEARSEDIATLASELAAAEPIRALLLPYQRSCARPPGLIADGRDMGTVVFPQALVKIFLQADPSARASRRYKQLKNMGIDASIRELDEVIRKRDYSDTSRCVSPLAVAADALVIDTTTMDKSRVLRRVAEVVSEKASLPMPDDNFFDG